MKMETTAVPIRFENVSLNFGRVSVHRDISFDVNQGEIVTILGPSGTGKTVLLKLMIGLLLPSSGKVSLFGADLSSVTEDELQKIRRNVGMLFQGSALFDSLNVYENIAYALRAARQFSASEIEAAVKRNLELINLPGIEDKFPAELSGGQKKRVALARALAISPRVVLFDEPTTGLDPTSVRLIDDLILKLKNDYGITSVVVTHDIESARRVSDRWILVHNGRVLANGSVGEVIAASSHVENFITGQWIE